MEKYEEITNDWNYDASCKRTSLRVEDLENFKRLIFVAQSAHSRKQKLAALYIPIARQAVQSSSEFYGFLLLYIFYFCLLTDIEQNRIVRANYYLMSECNIVALHNARSE
jgi:hypothetical protein